VRRNRPVLTQGHCSTFWEALCGPRYVFLKSEVYFTFYATSNHQAPHQFGQHIDEVNGF
jgi:hypothetical protein